MTHLEIEAYSRLGNARKRYSSPYYSEEEKAKNLRHNKRVKVIFVL